LEEKITLEEYRLWVLFHLTNDLLQRCEENTSASTGMTNQQFLVLWVMKFLSATSDKPITISDLAPILYRSLNSVSLIIDRMEKTGLVKKARNLSDRRAVQLLLTKRAERIFTDTARSNRDFIKQTFSIYSKRDQKTLLSLIKRLKNKLFKDLELDNIKADSELNNPEQILQFIDKLYSK
jgi:DNA-binding MarR family transcriptional regulator